MGVRRGQVLAAEAELGAQREELARVAAGLEEALRAGTVADGPGPGNQTPDGPETRRTGNPISHRVVRTPSGRPGH